MIVDKYTNLPVSRQRKHELRQPDKAKERRKRWRQTEQGKKLNREASRRYAEKHWKHLSEYGKQYRIKKALGE